ncbi:hypothetical protein F4861DRAFT_521022 [Xylaria intraflava]|nr:hypothetical protein F4861DRAFT_521022 [Xylaria intraflava]
MNSTICNHCRQALRRTTRQQRRPQSTITTATLTRPSRTPQPPTPIEATATTIAAHLSQPTWSVRSLLPPTNSPSTTTITPETLHHLLRLSALPPPKSPAEESQMLATLSSQLHFVRAIQRVDTAGITPLRVIRDETAQGLREQTIGLAQLQDALALEDVVGHARRPRRRRTQLAHAAGQTAVSQTNETGADERLGSIHRQDETEKPKQLPNEEESWDVLSGASETAGRRYFVVRSGGTGSLAE